MRVLIDGSARGPLVKLSAPLSFWGGVDAGLGNIIDRNHPQFGATLKGSIVSLPHGRGSSSSATVLAEMIRAGSAPSGLIIEEADQIIVTGAYVANVLYQKNFIVVQAPAPMWSGGSYILDREGLRPE